MATHTEDYVLGKGKMYFDGRYLGNCPAFNVSVDSETLEHSSSTSGISEVDASVTISIARTATIECDNISKDNLALFISGALSTFAQTGAAVTAEAHTVVTDRYYQMGEAVTTNSIGYQGLSAVSVQDVTDTTTYVLDTDYEVDLVLGRVYIIPGGAISDGDEIHVSYTYATNGRNVVATGSATGTTGKLEFIADNPKGTNRDLVAAQVELKPSGDFGFVGDDWLKMSFEVNFQTRDTVTPQVVIMDRAV